jgi:hypothetical protein
MRSPVFAVLLLAFATVAQANAPESIKAESLKQPPPPSLSPEIRGSVSDDVYRVLDQQGSPFAEVWLRKGIPAAHKPEGPKAAIQFPFLADGELIGVLQFATEGHDYREQPIAKGVYTMRYGLQPVNGDHLGVSTYRDYILLLPATKDRALAAPKRKALEERSAESAGTSHPASFLLLTPPADAAKPASVIHDEEKNTWGVVLPLSLSVKGKNEPAGASVLLIVVGAAAA